MTKHILITGASSGIGAALARHYSNTLGKKLILTLSGRNQGRLEKIVEECSANGTEVYATLLDVTNRAAMSQWISKADNLRPLDLVIANAGISGGTGDSNHEEWDQARKIFGVNLTGVLNTVEPAAQLMTVRKDGQIAIMSSLAGYRGWPGAPAYCASKAAIRVYGEALRSNLRNKNIKVNVICPGFIKSPMTDANNFAMPFKIPAEKAAKIIASGIEKDRGRIAFPLPMAFMAWLISSLPDKLAEIVTSKSPGKSSLPDTT